MDYDVLIVGGGVIGLSCARKFSAEGKKTLLIERHPSFGNETSSRNSEVIHAGIYYPENTLKAKLCVPGNRHLYEWCEKQNVPNIRIGKFIISVDETEVEDLERIYRQGKTNGVEGLVRYPIDKFRSKEPNIAAVAALWSPDTGIVNSHKLMESLKNASEENGCDFALKHTLLNIDFIQDHYQAEIADPEKNSVSIKVGAVINAAGLDSDRVAALAGIDIDKHEYRLNYCRGHYFRINNRRGMVKHLIYPTPPKNMSGLGIHLTLELDGGMKLGPDTMYLDENIQDYTIPEELHEKFYKAGSRYFNDLNFEDISPDQSGIRPKLQKEGGVYRDFVISEESDNGLPNFINLIGIESPGLTCCLEIADYAYSLLNK